MASRKNRNYPLWSKLSDIFRPWGERELDIHSKCPSLHRAHSSGTLEPGFDKAILDDVVLFHESSWAGFLAGAVGRPLVVSSRVNDFSSSSFNFTLGLRESDNRHAQ